MLRLGLSLTVAGLPVREGVFESERESAFCASFFAAFFAATALAKRSCNRSFVLLVLELRETSVST